MKVWKPIRQSVKKKVKLHLRYCHIMKKRAQEATKMAAGAAIFSGVGYGMHSLIEGLKTPEILGDYDFSFVDQSPSMFKVNKVGNSEGGPSTITIEVWLVIGALVIIACTPVVKLAITFYRMYRCGKNNEEV